MKRDYQNSKTNTVSVEYLHEHIAFHEAGHVSAIYLRNQQQKLPPIFFQITFNKQPEIPSQYIAKVDGGRLIENLAIAEIENTAHLAASVNLFELQHAYEADIINLLAGPLAEAKFVAGRDDEVFNSLLVNVYALSHYGGSYDVDQANKYLQCFIADRAQREAKLQDLFEQAFYFINDRENWQCISHFAQFLLDNEQEQITCEEASTVFESFCAKA